MRNASQASVPLFLLLGLGLVRCADMPPGFDAGASSSLGTDDAECNPTVQQDWGETCVPYENSCPANTSCQTVKDLGNAKGICSTECCGPDDHDHCPDVAPGLEKCVIEDTHYGKWYCAVICHDSADCDFQQTCQFANSIDRICYPSQSGG